MARQRVSGAYTMRSTSWNGPMSYGVSSGIFSLYLSPAVAQVYKIRHRDGHASGVIGEHATDRPCC